MLFLGRRKFSYFKFDLIVLLSHRRYSSMEANKRSKRASALVERGRLSGSKGFYVHDETAEHLMQDSLVLL